MSKPATVIREALQEASQDSGDRLNILAHVLMNMAHDALHREGRTPSKWRSEFHVYIEAMRAMRELAEAAPHIAWNVPPQHPDELEIAPEWEELAARKEPKD